MKSKIEIFKSKDNQTQVNVQFDKDTVWLSQKQMAMLFNKDTDTVSLHIKNIYKEKELEKNPTTEYYSVVQKEGKREVKRKIAFYNLDVIISVGYRVKSKEGTQFRIWATKRLKDFLVQGYAINEKRLAEKQQEIHYLKTGIQILSRAIESKAKDEENNVSLSLFTSLGFKKTENKNFDGDDIFEIKLDF